MAESIADKINFQGKKKRNKRKQLKNKKKESIIGKISRQLGFGSDKKKK